mmetsp:Transcript_12951/g.34691  ORF Transcript_12951/g.34691 Transcript_12951/m.34691 type:complete len:312 (-) Transcript_12951:37-972(-)
MVTDLPPSLHGGFGGPQDGGGSDVVVGKSALLGPQLDDEWHWVREDTSAWRFGVDGLELNLALGGIWGQVFEDLPRPPLLLRPLSGANACEVTVTMPDVPGAYGAQAGLFWYQDDDNYAKLVVECLEDGAAAIVLARERNGRPEVCAKVALDEDEAREPMRLRFEMSADSSKLSGVLVGSYYMRLIGSCPAGADTWGPTGEALPPLSIGVAAHGGRAEEAIAGRSAVLANFVAISVQPNRVQWGGGGSIPPARVPQPVASPVPEGYQPPAPTAGWTLSPDLSSEDRERITALLAQSGPPPAEEQEKAEGHK